MAQALARLQNTCLVHFWRTWLGTFSCRKYFGLVLQNNTAQQFGSVPNFEATKQSKLQTHDCQNNGISHLLSWCRFCPWRTSVVPLLAQLNPPCSVLSCSPLAVWMSSVLPGAPDSQHSLGAVQPCQIQCRDSKEGARKQAVENSGTLFLREWGFGSCQMLMLWSMRDFLKIAVHFLMFLVQYFSYH